MKDRTGVELQRGDHVVVLVSQRSHTLVEGKVVVAASNHILYEITSESSHSITYGTDPTVGDKRRVSQSHRIKFLYR